MSEIQLTPAQQAVVENRGGSLLVSAAAGSGKTKVLVERLFRYITQEHCNVDDFLIITYTKAAAAELRSKIAQEISKRLAKDPKDLHMRRQLLRVYQADIKTVDAFCTALLRENTHLLARDGEKRSLSPDFRVLDENEAKLLRERVLNRTLERFYQTLDDSGEQLANTLGFGRDDRSLTALVLELYEKLQSHAYPLRWLEENRKLWKRLETAEEPFDRTPYAAVLLHRICGQCRHWDQLLRDSAAAMAGCPALEKGYAGRFLAVADGFSSLADAAETGAWESARTAAKALVFPKLAPVKNTDGGELKSRAKKRWDSAKDSLKRMMELLDISSEDAMQDLAAAAAPMQALLDLTGAFAEDYRMEKLRQNAADFSDQEHLALQILVTPEGVPTETGAQISARYQEILVDEYQDTNEVQNAIFRAVSRSGQNLFTVGDVKQSIYRFRLADPTIFLKKYASFRPYTEAKEGEDRKILLSQNFRSRREILDAANFIFENILSPEMGEMVYGEEEALHFGAAYYPERFDCQTEFHLIACQQRRGEGERPVKRLTAEARLTALRIRQLLEEGYPVTGADGSLRPCREEDFVILMRSPGSRGAAYADALAEQGLTCAYEENQDFFSSMEISCMLSMLAIIDNPRQDVPLIAVLRSPVFRFSPDRLAEIRGKTREGDFYHAVSQDGGEDCRQFLKDLTELRLLSRDMSVYRLIWHIYNRWNLLGIFGAMDRGQQRRENLIALTEHAEKLESGGYCGVYAFVTQLKRLLETGRAPQTRGASDSAGIRIMSIHKSKGLEFPIVILTDLDHAFSRQDFTSPVLVHPELGLGPVRIDLQRKIKYPTLARRAVEETLLRENKAEEQRILYVAMTRPKEKLILVDAMYHVETRLKRLVPLASCPVLPEAVSAGKNFADWILLPLLCRPEAAPLRAMAEMEADGLYTGATAPWQVTVHDAEEFREIPHREHSMERETESPQEQWDLSLLEFQYPYSQETMLPAKVTATQLKGREIDAEISEQASHPPVSRTLSQPRFRQERAGLTSAETGTAIHLALQYLNFSDLDVAAQVESLCQRRLLTKEQAQVVPAALLERFLHTELAEEIRRSAMVLREYPFTVLISARELDGTAASGDEVLMQGIVDCCFTDADGALTIVDFKTDHVFGAAVQERAKQYQAQMTAYSRALQRVLERPVRRRVLYFLQPGVSVEVPDASEKEELGK